MKPLNLHDIIIDRSEAAKAAFVNKARQELKDLGYAVVDSRYLKGLMVQAKRMEVNRER